MKVSIELISDYLVLVSHDNIPVTDIDEAPEGWTALTTMFNLSAWWSVMLIDICIFKITHKGVLQCLIYFDRTAFISEYRDNFQNYPHMLTEHEQT